MGDHRLPVFVVVLLTLFSGAGGAVIAALITSNEVAVETTTVRGPAVTEYVQVSKGGGAPCAGSKVAGGPPYEPNDVVASAYGPLHEDQPIEARLETFDDKDFYAFCVAERERVTVRVEQTGCPESGTCYDASAELLNDEGKSIATTQPSETTVGAMTKALKPGRYFVLITNGPGFRYRLSVTTSNGRGLASTMRRQ